MNNRDEHRVPVIEERVRIDKRLVESGVVRIKTTVAERHEAVATALTREEVEIERVPIGREIDHAPELREEGDTLIIPVIEERVVVSKRLVLVEELHVRRKTLRENATIPVELRSTEVHVERESGPTPSANPNVGTGEAQ